MATKKKVIKRTPKKKAPVPKKKPRKKLAIPKSIAPLSSSVKRADKKHFDKLRVEAMAVYVMDLEGATITELHQDPRFKDLDLKTLRTWCAEDNWVSLRAEALEKTKDKLKKELTYRLSENVYREVRDIMDLRKRTRDLLFSSFVPAKSFEGLGKLFLDLNKRLAEISELVKEGTVDDLGRKVGPVAQTGAPTVINYDPKDLRAAARYLTEKKRSAMRAREANMKKANGEVD